MRLRVLFLDVDGVLNNAGEFRKQGAYVDSLSDACMDRLARIVHEGKVDLVVLSSTWRLAGEGSDHIQILRSELRKRGVEIHSRTSFDNRQAARRGDEIEKWLEDNRVNASIVILDDDIDMLDWQEPFFVRTYFEDGLTDEDVMKAIAILEKC